MTFGPHLEKKTNCIPEAVARINSAENNKISPNNTTDHNLDLGSSEILTMFFFWSVQDGMPEAHVCATQPT